MTADALVHRRPGEGERLRRGVRVLVALASAMGSGALRAPVLLAAEPASGAVKLAWDVPAGCPSANAVLENAERILASSARPRTALQVAAHVTATQGPSWQAELTLDVAGTKTERRFAAESCDAVAAAASLIIAVAASDVAADGEWPGTRRETEALPEQENDGDRPEAPPAPDTSASPSLDANLSASAATMGSAPPWAHGRLVASVNGLVGWRTLPGAPALGIDTLIGQQWRPDGLAVRALFGAAYFPYRTFTDAGNSLFDLWVAELSGRVCVGFGNARFEVGPCMGITGSLMHARGVGSSSVTTKDVVWFSFLAAASASVKLTDGLALTLRGDLQLPAVQPEIHDDWNPEPLYVLPATAFRTALGMEAIF